MAGSIENYAGTGVFIFVERLYSRDAPNWHGVGASMVQIHKMVYQLYHKQDVYLEGKKIEHDSATVWQRLKILFGADLVQKNAADNSTCFSLDYAGSRFVTTPFSGIDSKKIPDFLTREYTLPGRNVLAFGSDPFPHVSLYGRSDARFVMAEGGKGDPTAAAKYDAKSKQLVMVDPGKELPQLMQRLKTRREMQ